MKVTAIIVAAGEAKRMGKDKNFLLLLGKPLLSHTLRAFEKAKTITDVILVVRKGDVETAANLFIKKLKLRKIAKVVEGGRERQASVLKGLRWVRPDADLVAIHDGARPLVSPGLIERAVRACRAKDVEAVTAAVRVNDTVKKARGTFVERTLDRNELWLSQTPQVFRHRTILAAHLMAFGEGFAATDDVQLVERMGIRVKIVEGMRENIKITFPEDMVVAEAFLKRKKKK